MFQLKWPIPINIECICIYLIQDRMCMGFTAINFVFNICSLSLSYLVKARQQIELEILTWTAI